VLVCGPCLDRQDTAKIISLVVGNETKNIRVGGITAPKNLWLSSVHILISALTFKDFVSRLELLTLFRNFWRSMKMCKNELFQFVLQIMF